MCRHATHAIVTPQSPGKTETYQHQEGEPKKNQLTLLLYTQYLEVSIKG